MASEFQRGNHMDWPVRFPAGMGAGAMIFRHGAQWVQLRTDERNGRSAAAIRKLGATELGIRSEHLVRRDGTRRRSRIFRLDRPSSGAR